MAVYEIFLPPSTKLRQGNVFTHVCHSVHRGVYPSMHRVETRPSQTPWANTTPPPQVDTPHRVDTPLGRQPPAQCMLGYSPQCMLGYSQQVDSMHPTGMHSC